MRKRFLQILLCLLVTVISVRSAYVYRRGPLLRARPVPQRPRLIAHAGGTLKRDQPYTNSLEALNHSYEQGFRLFELDFNWTSDGYLVCIHDWEQTFTRYFPDHDSERPSLDSFTQLTMKDGLNQLTLAGVADWLHSKPDAFIVTDIKVDNLKGLDAIATNHPELMPQFIPQVYDPSELAPARAKGFQEIILTLYRCPLSRRDLLTIIEGEDLFAVTLPVARVKRWNFASNLKNGGFFTYAHTINSLHEFNNLKAAGVCGAYTDSISPAEIASESTP